MPQTSCSAPREPACATPGLRASTCSAISSALTPRCCKSIRIRTGPCPLRMRLAMKALCKALIADQAICRQARYCSFDLGSAEKSRSASFARNSASECSRRASQFMAWLRGDSRTSRRRSCRVSRVLVIQSTPLSHQPSPASRLFRITCRSQLQLRQQHGAQLAVEFIGNLADCRAGTGGHSLCPGRCAHRCSCTRNRIYRRGCAAHR